GTTNPYNTTLGAKASTTGNVYGVYDMSGGAFEYVAVFNNRDKYDRVTSYGWSGLTTNSASDKYATKYLNTTSNDCGNNIIYKYGKIGDATKEVNKGGAYALSNTSSYDNWFGDTPILCYWDGTFVARGGFYNKGASAGVFYSIDHHGYGYSYGSFRVVLCP
ncbi:MAG: hypothetical protein IKM97_00270, partial [Clostridia bacterium]|nr:hypothetical protein [Clostridia bacterium]